MPRYLCLCAVLFAGAVWADPPPLPPLKLLATVPVGGDGRWDFVTCDSTARRLYVPRSTHVQVLDLDTGTLLGDLPGTNGVHGVALAPEQKLGFTSNGKDNTVTVFELATLKVVKTIPTGVGPDAIIYDAGSRRILVMDHRGGDVTVIDPAALDQVPAHITVGGTLECAAADGAGRAYVAVEDKSEVVVLDTRAQTVLARWSLAPGAEPTGLALDAARHRLYAGCANQKLVVLDTATGQVLATPAIGAGVDGVVCELTSGVVLTANGKDGTVSVVRETAPGQFETVQTVKSVLGARTLDLDVGHHRVVLPCRVPDGQGGETFGLAVVGVAGN